MQLVARKVASLPSTQLEVAAFAFSAPGIITYLLYWNRSQGVESLHITTAKILHTSVGLRDIAQSGPVYLWSGYRPEIMFEKELDLAQIPNDSSHCAGASTFRLIRGVIIEGNDEIASLAAGALFGGTLF